MEIFQTSFGENNENSLPQMDSQELENKQIE